MKRSDMIGILAVAGALAFGACDQNSRPGSAERGGTTSAPASRSPSGAASPGASGTAATASPSSSMDQSGTGGAGDAGYGARDGGMR